MKTITCFFIAAMITICAVPISAKIWIVDNTGGNHLADFTTISEAYTNTQNGDTLYVYGSVTSYGSLTLSKPLYFFGPGYFLDENPETQVRKVSAVVDYIGFNPGSEGSVFAGFEVTGNTTELILITTKNIVIKKNHIIVSNGYGINVSSGLDYIAITQNYIEKKTNHGASVINFGGRNSIICNNYIFQINDSNSAIYFSEDDPSAVVRNNVIRGKVIMRSNCIFSNNILISGAFNPNGCDYTNNIGNGQQFGNDNNNQSGVNMSTVFVDSASHSTDGKWQLATGSPAIEAGSDGTDCGMFGGDFPYVLSGLPSIPTIYFFQAPLRGAQNQGLNVKIKVRSIN